MKKIFATLILAAIPLCAQTNRFPAINLYAGDPTGVSCSPANTLVQSTTTGGIYSCLAGVWGTSYSSGNPVPINEGGTSATTASGALANLGGAPLTGTGTSGTWPISTTGNAATATNVPYSGLTGTVPTWNQSTTGNAATATNVTGTVAVANGGTGSSTAAGALTNLGGAALSGATFTGPVSAPIQDQGGAYFNLSAYSNSIANAAAAAWAVGGSVFTPQGSFSTSSMVATQHGSSGSPATYYGAFLGSNAASSVWNFTGTSTTEALLRIGANASSPFAGNNYSYNHHIENMFLNGNSHNTYGLELWGTSNTVVSHVGVANGATSGTCMYLYGVVANTLISPFCDQDLTGTFTSTPTNGLIIDGYNNSYQSTTSTVITPTFGHFHAGYGIGLNDAAINTVIGAQVGDNLINLYVGSYSIDNAWINPLAEGNASYTDNVKIDGVNTSFFLGQLSGSNVHLTGTGHNTHFYGTDIGNGSGGGKTIQIDSGTYGNVFRDIYGGFTFTDNGHLTRIDGVYHNGVPLENFPQEQLPLPNGADTTGFLMDYSVRIAGFFYAPAGTTKQISTDTYTTGKAWKMELRGIWNDVGYGLNAPTDIVINETSNTVTCGSTTATFAVNGSGRLTMTAATGADCGFTGEILFLPDNAHTTTTETYSASYANGVNASSYYVAGSALGFSNLPGFTKASKTAQSADVGEGSWGPFYVTTVGHYRLSLVDVVTQQATTSSTLPPLLAQLFDGTTGGASGWLTLSTAATTNLVNVTQTQATYDFYVVSDAISVYVATDGYASSGATAMQFALYAKLEYLGP